MIQAGPSPDSEAVASRANAASQRALKPVNLVGNACEGSTALTLVPLEAQSLRSHALHLFIKCVNFLIEPRVLRFRRLAAAQLFERFLNGEFGGFGHGNPSSLF
jgi:hypothetical protein